jgi:hypothetical protein
VWASMCALGCDSPCHCRCQERHERRAGFIGKSFGCVDSVRQEDAIQPQIAIDFRGASRRSWARRRGRCRRAWWSARADAMRGARHRANGVNRYLGCGPWEKDVAQAYVDHCIAILDLGGRRKGGSWRSSPVLEDEGAGAGRTVAFLVLIGDREDSGYHFRARRVRWQLRRLRRGGWLRGRA